MCLCIDVEATGQPWVLFLGHCHTHKHIYACDKLYVCVYIYMCMHIYVTSYIWIYYMHVCTNTLIVDMLD